MARRRHVMSNRKTIIMKKIDLRKMAIVAAAIAFGSIFSASIATDALARGGGGGGHGGGSWDGAHFGGGGGATSVAEATFGGGLTLVALTWVVAFWCAPITVGLPALAVHAGAGRLGAQVARGVHRGFRHRGYVGADRRLSARSLRDSYAYDSSNCWQRYRVRVHGKLQWHRRWVCG